MISFLKLQMSAAGTSRPVDMNTQCFEEWHRHAGSNLTRTVSGSPENYTNLQQATGARGSAPWNTAVNLLRQNPQALGAFGTVMRYVEQYMQRPEGNNHLIQSSEDSHPFESALRDFFRAAASLGSLFSTLQVNTQEVVNRMSTSAFCREHSDSFCCINAFSIASSMEVERGEAGIPQSAVATTVAPDASVQDATVQDASADAEVRPAIGYGLVQDMHPTGDAGTATTSDVPRQLWAANPSWNNPVNIGGTGTVAGERAPVGQIVGVDAGSSQVLPQVWTDIVVSQSLTASRYIRTSRETTGAHLAQLIGTRIRNSRDSQALLQNQFKVEVSIEYTGEAAARVTRISYNRNINETLTGIVRSAVSNVQIPHFQLPSGQRFPQAWHFTVTVN